MTIRIQYLRSGETAPRSIKLSPEEYFGPLEEGDTFSVDSVPRCQDAYEYTGQPADALRWTVVDVADNSEFRRMRTQLLDGTHSMMTHSLDSKGGEEIIHTTEICLGCWHTIRTLKEPGKAWTVVMSHLTPEGPAPLLQDHQYCGSWSFDEMKSFGAVRAGD